MAGTHRFAPMTPQPQRRPAPRVGDKVTDAHGDTWEVCVTSLDAVAVERDHQVITMTMNEYQSWIQRPEPWPDTVLVHRGRR